MCVRICFHFSLGDAYELGMVGSGVCLTFSEAARPFPRWVPHLLSPPAVSESPVAPHPPSGKNSYIREFLVAGILSFSESLLVARCQLVLISLQAAQLQP